MYWRLLAATTFCVFIIFVLFAKDDSNKPVAVMNNVHAAIKAAIQPSTNDEPSNTPKPTSTSQRQMFSTLSPELKDSQLSPDFLRRFYSKQAPKRAANLKTINAASKFQTLYNVLVPEVYCPNLVRVGNVNDGGKWVCNPPMMPKENCSVYSLGIREDITFDQELQAFNGNKCRLYGYDLTPQTQGTKDAYSAINGKAFTMKISAQTKNGTIEKTLGDILRGNGDSFTEMLKMDIEGSEYTTLVNFLKEFKTCQIFLEMHGKSLQMLNLLVEVARQGYGLFSYEINGYDMAACEYSFIHPSCYQKYGAFEMAYYLKDSAPNIVG